ncbi:MAG TPA: aspartate-semialdehyde dehydrogenase [Candidatus Acidoferrales bacterium]|nr:aspartate-semialdehyde dehydrogenase [Candidatus Acidoferrales bacterium]
MNRTVAILGATGQVGRTTLALLEARAFPLDRLRLLASPRAGERSLPFRGASVPVEPVSAEAFRGVEIALFAVRNPVAIQWAGPAQAAGAVVIDTSSAHRYDERVPLVVPEVNGDLLDARPTLVANPNCSAAPIVLALAALEPLGRLERLTVATYQSVSGAGTAALAELERGLRAGVGGGSPPPREDGGPPFALNCIPLIDRFEDNGYSREEMKVVWETRKILRRPDLAITVTAVRVPVRIGHGAAVHAGFDRPVDVRAARERWRAFPGLEVADDPARGLVPTPLAAAGRDAVVVGRARTDLADPRGLAFFVVSDNLRKGAALNAVQIAERWVAAPAVRR